MRQPVARRGVLPLEEESHKGRWRHGLDLLPQPADRVPVYMRQYSPIAELLFLATRCEVTSQDPAGGLHMNQGDVHGSLLHTQRHRHLFG